MNMRYLSLLLLSASALFCQADDYAFVDFSYFGQEYSTNFTVTMNQGESFIFTGPVSPGCNVKSFNVYRDLRQFESRCVLLCVGISKYRSDSNIAPLPCCKTDAEQIGSQLAPYYEEEYLFDTEATKGNIRAAISKYAGELNPGDTFLYYHSGQAMNTNIACYDGIYYEADLMSDLGDFKKGVNIAVIRDLNFSGAVKPRNIGKEITAPDNLSDILLITADKKITKKKYKAPMSPFTTLLIGSIEPSTDQNLDCTLTFKEMFQRASDCYAEMSPGGTCTLENDILAETLIFSVLDEGSVDGLLEQKEDSVSIIVPNIQNNVSVSVIDDYFPTPIEIEKGNYKLSIKEKNGEKTYSEKFDLSFKILDNGILNFPEDRIGLYFNSKAFYAWFNEKLTRTGFVTPTADYCFKKFGKLQVKKKGDIWICRYTFQTKNSKDYSKIFSSESDIETLNMQYRNFFNIFQGSATFQKVYKTGKSLTARLAK